MTLRAPLATRIERRSSRGVLNSQREVSSNRLLDLLSSQDAFFGSAGLAPKYDYPNPRGKRYPSHLRTFTSQYRNQWWYNPATEQYVVAAAGPYDAFSCFDDTNSAAGNILVLSKTWTPSGNPVLCGTDGMPYDALPSSGRQSLTYREWSFATGTWVVATGAVDGITSTYWINNQAPVEVTPIANQSGWTHIAQPMIIISAGVTDGEGDTLTYTGLSVPGMAITTETVGLQSVQAITGTPTVAGTYVVTITVTDITGASINLTPFTWVIGTGVAVPASSGVLMAAYITALASAGLTLDGGDVTIADYASPVGEVDHTSPVAGVYVPPGSPVQVFVSGDVTPAAFSFTDQTGVAYLTLITSNAITVSGIDLPVAISVTGGEYSLNGGAFTAVTGTAVNGDTVCVRHTTPATVLTATSTVLTIGGVSDTFITTTAQDRTFTLYEPQNTNAGPVASNYVICDRTGFRVLPTQLVKEWSGAMVRRQSWEARHPQDFVRARPEHPKGSPRPEQADVFIQDDEQVEPEDL